MTEKQTDKYKRRLQEEGIQRNTEESLEWLRKRLRKIRVILPENFIDRHDDFVRSRVYEGFMYAFMYDPKTKDKLPYYDRFPLIFVFKTFKDGFIGINLHYLPPKQRAELYRSLLSRLVDNKYNMRTRILISWDILKALSTHRYLKGIVKRYSYANVDSRILKIPSDVWEVAVMLPTEAFIKEVRASVWRETIIKSRA